MKHATSMLVGLIFTASLHAAEPAPPAPANEEGPAVITSPAAAQEPVTGRGNPRRPELTPTETPAVVPSNAAAQNPRPAATATPARGSADRIELDTTQITGNSELPRVMYVVPWKRPELGDPGGRPARSLLDEVLEPVDRDVFRRQNRYYDALQPDGARAVPKGEN